jgi:hypothetical protein
MKRLIAPHSPRHTHPSEAKVISLVCPPKTLITLLPADWISIRAISRKIWGNKGQSASYALVKSGRLCLS